MSPFLILLFFISTKFVALGIYGFILGLGLWLAAKNIKRNSPQVAVHTEQARQKQQTQQKKQARTQTLSMYTDAAHLTLLLSKKGNTLLADLIDAINKLHGYLPYLQKHHAYLAVSVSELIKDLTENTIIRLDTLASEFVHNGLVHTEEKQLFVQQHEVRIQALLTEHSDEVNQLNQRILEKKMASFNEVGNPAESKFRNSVMELKILLRWLIAKTPDNQVSSHDVLLKRLEETTLKKMHEVFYKADTTDVQRSELQQQVEDLIVHFKAQSPTYYQTDKNTPENPWLLEYSETQALEFLNKTDVQDFIEFNAQYVKQLKKHWH